MFNGGELIGVHAKDKFCVTDNLLTIILLKFITRLHNITLRSRIRWYYDVIASLLLC